MDLSLENNRPHFRSTSSSSTTAAAITSNNNTTELFICFTSRTSSMKLTKSILSPARAARDGGASLSSSLSRRLRTNGSLKGGASPFFPTTKKRGCGFDNPEPSSPKVTCIGQVRVKTKKKVQRRSLSRRRSGGGGGGEVSFRKIEQSENGSGSANHYQQQPECLPHHRNQRWVHLPVSICEALSSCLFPCKSSCFSTSNDNDNCGCGGGGGDGDRSCENGCGAVFARWLVSVNEGNNGKRREIELVVGGGEEIDNNNVVVEGEEEERVSMRRRSSRRHVFDDIEVKDDNRIEVKGQLLQRCEEEEVVESGRVSICVPPKNALLLMRCRSDPMKMADLASRFSWDAHASKDIRSGIVEEEGIEEFVRECGGSKDEIFMVKEDEVTMSEVLEQEEVVAAVVVTNAVEENEIPEIHEEEELVTSTHCDEVEVRQELQSEIEVNDDEALVEEEEQPPQEQEEEEEEVESNMSSFEDLLNREAVADQHYEDCYPIQEKEQEQEQEEENSPICHLSPSITESQSESEDEIISDSGTTELVPLLSDEETTFHKQEQEPTVIAASNSGKPEQQQQQQQQEQQELVIVENTEPPPPPLKKEKETPPLPDCLLLMMCEPKLSMEVSKETWVCTTDFVKWLPQRPPKQPPRPPATKTEPPVKRRLSTDSKPKLVNDNAHKEHQPPRSSCSLPAAVLERKLVNAVAYEPFVLTRCKSEPMRTTAAKLMPVQPDHQSCVWKNAVRKMEPHRRATVGVGPA